MTKDLTHAIQAAVAKAIASGQSREQVEREIYEMRQAAMREEEEDRVPLLPDDDLPPAA
jgi:hypothetical protein